MTKFDEAHVAKLKEAGRRHSENYQVGNLIRQTDRSVFTALLFELKNPRSQVLSKIIAYLDARGKTVGNFL